MCTFCRIRVSVGVYERPSVVITEVTMLRLIKGDLNVSPKIICLALLNAALDLLHFAYMSEILKY